MEKHRPSQHAKVRDFTSRHACAVKFGFRQVQVCFIAGSLPVILSSMGATHHSIQTLHPNKIIVSNKLLGLLQLGLGLEIWSGLILYA